MGVNGEALQLHADKRSKIDLVKFYMCTDWYIEPCFQGTHSLGFMCSLGGEEPDKVSARSGYMCVIDNAETARLCLASVEHIRRSCEWSVECMCTPCQRSCE